MADGFDFANLGQMFGPGIGGTPTGIDALLSEEQRKLLGRNAAMSAAAALLQAGGPSRTPINLGQALGGALQAGQAGYQQARAGALQDVMLGEKLKEAQRAAQLQQQLQRPFPQLPKWQCLPPCLLAAVATMKTDQIPSRFCWSRCWRHLLPV